VGALVRRRSEGEGAMIRGTVKVGYVRTSMKDQNPELQRRDLTAFTTIFVVGFGAVVLGVLLVNWPKRKEVAPAERGR
jgi:hypothetical protein